MGHRALVAYERPDGQYNLHFSHWGGNNLRLKYELSEKTPFGGDEPNHPWVTAVFEFLNNANEPGLPDIGDSSQPDTTVDPTPLVLGVSFDETISEYLDYQLHEAFYEVSTTFEVTAYLTFWLGFSTVADTVSRSPSVGHGILSTVRWYRDSPIDNGYLRGWFEGAKAIIGEFLDRGDFTESQATTFLLERMLNQCRPTATCHVRRQDQ